MRWDSAQLAVARTRADSCGLAAVENGTIYQVETGNQT